MPKVIFDTDIFISRKRMELPKNFYMSVVVLAELVAGAEDEAGHTDQARFLPLFIS